MKKRIFVLVSLILVAVIILAGCAKTVETPTEVEDTAEEPIETPIEVKEAAEETNKEIVIGLSEPSLGWPYIAAYVKEFESLVAKAENVRVITLSADASIEKQTNDINDLIVQNVDIILVCSLDGRAVIPAIKKAYEAGIPVLAVSNEPFEEGKQYLAGYSGPDDYEQGRIAADIMIEAIGNEGDIIMIEGTAGQSTTQLRADGFKDRVAEKGAKINIVAQQPCDWDSAKEKTATQTFLNKYGDQIKGVFAQGGGAAVGEAVDEAGYDIPVVCTGLKSTTYEAVKNGLVYGSMSQSPFLDASQGLELALRIVNGEKLEQHRNIIPMPVVTQKNIAEFKPDF